MLTQRAASLLYLVLNIINKNREAVTPSPPKRGYSPPSPQKIQEDQSKLDEMIQEIKNQLNEKLMGI